MKKILLKNWSLDKPHTLRHRIITTWESEQNQVTTVARIHVKITYHTQEPDSAAVHLQITGVPDSYQLVHYVEYSSNPESPEAISKDRGPPWNSENGDINFWISKSSPPQSLRLPFRLPSPPPSIIGFDILCRSLDFLTKHRGYHLISFDYQDTNYDDCNWVLQFNPGDPVPPPPIVLPLLLQQISLAPPPNPEIGFPWTFQEEEGQRRKRPFGIPKAIHSIPGGGIHTDPAYYGMPLLSPQIPVPVVESPTSSVAEADRYQYVKGYFHNHNMSSSSGYGPSPLGLKNHHQEVKEETQKPEGEDDSQSSKNSRVSGTRKAKKAKGKGGKTRRRRRKW